MSHETSTSGSFRNQKPREGLYILYKNLKIMDKATYEQKLKELNDKFRSDERRLHHEFGMSQAIYKVGDIIKSASKSPIKIDKITTYKSFGDPVPVYHGLCLKKDLTPMKKMERDAIYGHHLVELVKSEE